MSLCLALTAGLSVPARAQEVLDETVATVNGELIAKSDLLWNLALDKSVSPEQFWRRRPQRFMLESVLDQRLLLQEAAKLPATSVGDEEVAEAIARITADFSSVDDPDRFVRRQALVGLTRQRLQEIVRNRIRIEKFVDFRFKSFVVVTEAEIDRFFEDEIRPEMESRGQVLTEQEKARQRPKAEESIVARKVRTELDEYLAEARAKAEIVFFGDWERLPAEGKDGP